MLPRTQVKESGEGYGVEGGTLNHLPGVVDGISVRRS